MSESLLNGRGEVLDDDARLALSHTFQDVVRKQIIDELGNGWFVRNLLDRAGEARDIRVMSGRAEPQTG